MIGKILRNSILAISLVTSVLLTGCQDSQTKPSSSNVKAQAVDVAEVLVEQITELDEYTARLTSPQTVSVVPRISGMVEKVYFREGSEVKAGDILFSIDDRQFSSEVQRLKAELESAQISLKQTAQDYARALKLIKTNAVSQEALDARYADKQRSAASVSGLTAALTQAKINLEFTQVRSPIDGLISNASVTKGNYVTAGQTELTTINSNAFVYAYFNVDERSFMKYRQQGMIGLLDSESNSFVQMSIADDSGFTYVGVIDFVDNQIDETTGTIRARAVFDNAQNTLLPGMFVKLRIAGSENYSALLVDNKAIGTDLNSKYVLVLGQDNVVHYRSITLGETINGLRIVKSGLKSGEKVVVNGLRRVRDQSTVAPNEIPMANRDILSHLRQQQSLITNQRHTLLSSTLD